MSLTPKTDELRIFLQHEKVDICCITETWLKDTIDDNVICIQNYQIVRKDRIYAQHGGVALYVKESIKLDRLHDYEVQVTTILKSFGVNCGRAVFLEVSQD